MPITYSGSVSCWSSASGSRYRKTSELRTSRRIPCSCSVSGRAFRRARRSATKPGRAAAAAAAGPALSGGAITPLMLDFEHFARRGEEGLQDARIEVAAGLGAHVVERLLARPGLLVRPHRGQRVVHVGHRDDARAQRDVVADEAVRVPRAVVFLVVAERDERA